MWTIFSEWERLKPKYQIDFSIAKIFIVINASIRRWFLKIYADSVIDILNSNPIDKNRSKRIDYGLRTFLPSVCPPQYNEPFILLHVHPIFMMVVGVICHAL